MSMIMTEAKTDAKLLTADDLLRLYSDGVRGELIRGELRETMPTGGEHGETVMILGAALVNFARTRRLGRIAGSDSGVLLERDPDTVRELDLAFFSADTIPAGARVTGYYEVVPDIVGEVVSPNDTAREIDDKARMWIRYGAGLVWVLNPDTRTVAVYSQDGTVTVLGDGDVLDGGDVLPGSQAASATFSTNRQVSHPLNLRLRCLRRRG